MPSPFPGMNPYLERPDVWNDFHDSFIPAAREALVPHLLPRYYVRIEEHLFIHEPPAKKWFPLGRPDLSVHPAAGAPAAGVGAAVVAPASVGMPVIVEEERLPYLEIRDRDRNEAVTVVELLSPANKATGPHRNHLAKVRRILSSRTNFVEVDLLRADPKMPWDQLPACDYYALVSRHARRASGDPRADLWPLHLRDPLPSIPIPLRPGEPEPSLDLQALLHRVYDAAGYAMFLYQADPDPPLSGADAVWAAQLLHPPAVAPAAPEPS
ncbi:MAG: hypothetical protein C0501_17710 [Isosphaera sp.]|nr:hypothetical protein [Isosphaera sp.]